MSTCNARLVRPWCKTKATKSKSLFCLKGQFFLKYTLFTSKKQGKTSPAFLYGPSCLRKCWRYYGCCNFEQAGSQHKKQLLDVVPQLFSQLFMMKNPLFQKGTQSWRWEWRENTIGLYIRRKPAPSGSMDAESNPIRSISAKIDNASHSEFNRGDGGRADDTFFPQTSRGTCRIDCVQNGKADAAGNGHGPMSVPTATESQWRNRPLIQWQKPQIFLPISFYRSPTCQTDGLIRLQ